MVTRVAAIVVLFLLAVAIGAAGAWEWLARSRAAPPVLIATAEPVATAQMAPAVVPTPTPGPIQVYVNGAVARPDVYLLPADGRIKQAILAAGGFTAEADTVLLNLAQPLYDGMYIFVATQGVTPPPIPPPDLSQTTSRSRTVELTSGLININTASQVELESLPGIGPSTAQKILDYRETHGPFPQIEAILEVPGIGEVKFQQIRDLISTGN